MFRKLRILFRRWRKPRQSSECYFTKEEALEIARKYHLEYDVMCAMKFGFNPDEALEDWDLFPYEKVMDGTLKKKKINNF